MIEIRFTKTGVVGITKTQLGEIGRAAMNKVGHAWWKLFLPIHFTRRAMQRYGYRPRVGDPGSGRPFKGSYAEAKVKRRENGQGVRAIGENKPFVWSGNSRAQALSQPNINAVRENYRSYRADVFINAPTLNFVRDASKEIRATVAEEEQALERIFADEFELQLNRVGRTAKQTTLYRGAA